MSGQQPPPYGNGPRGWNPRAHNPASPSPSSFLYRPPSPWTTAPSPPPIIAGPRPFGHAMSPAPLNQHQHQHPTSSFQLSPTPSPIVCQTPSSDFTYSNRQTPLSHQSQQSHYQQQAPPPQYLQQLHQQGLGPPIPPQPRQHGHGLAQDQIDFIGVPLEPPQPRSYVIYDDEEEFGPSTAEIIANQSQDYVDEKLAEYQMTILQLQAFWQSDGGI
ncbi:leucine-rich repeat extensin-like protein 3 [Drosophila persimilis]|uniref:leucine-rich repeat extensin-like protein 3 n=1 Tax=Drosophila persimilis TaxID=7234 RepID=UPI000F07E077|nr:leucine-rich repeat extensin-like protein 3 [Drosophila persimilis]